MRRDIEALDSNDPLAPLRAEFLLPANTIYLDGNSLGPLPRAAAERARTTVEQQWAMDLIASWNSHGWIDLPVTTGEKIAPLIGAGPGQVICCDSISVNLFKLLAVALQLRPGRHVILSQQDNFPTDLYMGQGLSRLLGQSRCELRMVEESALPSALTDEVAVLLLSQVNFRDGSVHDMARLTAQAHEQGALVIWDLAHSAGVLPLAVDDWQVDFALGCGYKFLNGGPGAPAFVYANKRHHGQFQQPLQGWMGHRAPFEFSPEYQAASGMASFLTGTPPILSLAVLDEALSLFANVSMQQLRDKSLALSNLFIELLQEYPALESLQLRSPRQESRRGSQLAFAHPEAYAICQALIAEGVIADFRNPDLLRFGFSPLVLRYRDIEESVKVLDRIMASEMFLAAQFQKRQKVT
jgi:kynureninase